MAFRGGRGGGRGGMVGRSNTVSTKLYVANIPETCRRGELQKLFEEYGTVVECDIVKNYGFVHYSTPDEAQTAQESLDNYPFEGLPLKVELSHSKVRQKPGMGGKQECYRCGKEGHWSKDCPKGPPQPYSTRPRLPERGGFGRDPYPRDPYARDPYADAYYRERAYPPPPPMDRYRPYPEPYERRAPPPPSRDPYYADRLDRARDPYARPPPEYYGRRDPYESYYERRSYLPPPPGTSRMSPTPRARVAPY